MTPNRERVWVGLFVVIAVAVLSGTAVAVWGGAGPFGRFTPGIFQIQRRRAGGNSRPLWWLEGRHRQGCSD